MPCLANIDLSALMTSLDFVVYNKVVDVFQLAEVCAYDLPGAVW